VPALRAEESLLQLTVHRGEEAFTALRAEWNPLLHRAHLDTLFLTWEFQTTWWRHFSEGEMIVLAYRAGDDLAAIVPLYVTTASGQRRVRLIGGTEVADYLDFIVAPGYEEQAISQTLDWLNGPHAPAWDLLEWVNVPEEGVLYRHFASCAQARGWQVESRQEDVCPIIPLPETWEGYLALLNKHQRHEIRRKLRRIEEQARVRWYIVDASHNLPGEVDRFIALHELSSPDKDAFMTDEMKRFFHALARALLDAGWLQLSFIEVNDAVAASMYCFDYQDRVLVYNSGYDPNQYAHLSPGIVLLSRCIEHAIRIGKRYFDFMQGDEEYKYRFGGQDTRVYRITAKR